MRSSSLALVLAAGFLAAAVVGAFFMIAGAAAAGPYDAIPERAEAVVEIRDDAAWRLVAGSSGPDGRPGLLPAWAARAFPPLESRREDRFVLAAMPSLDGGPAEVLIAWSLVSPDEMERALGELRPRLGGAMGRWITRVHHGRSMEILAAGDGPSPCLGRLKETLLIGGAPRTCLEAFDAAAGRAKALGSSQTFAQARSRWERRGSLGLYLSGTALQPGALPPWTGRAAGLLGIGPLRAISASIRIRSGGSHETFEFLHEEAPGGLASILASVAPMELSFDRASAMLPGDLPIYAAVSLSDLGMLWSRLPGLAASADLADEASLKERLRGLDEFLEADVGKDLLGVFSPEAVLGFDPGNPLPRGGSRAVVPAIAGAAALTITRPGGFRSFRRRAEGFARLLGGVPEPEPSGIVAWRIPGLTSVRPSYRVQDQLLGVATDPSLLSRAAAAAGASLGARADIEEARGRLPRRSHALLFVDGEVAGLPLPGLCLGAADRMEPSVRALSFGFNRRRVHVETSAARPLIVDCLSASLASRFGAVMEGEPTPLPAINAIPDPEDEPL